MVDGQQYLGTGWFAELFTFALVVLIIGNIIRANTGAKKGKDVYIRRIAGLNAIDEAVGRATEMGRPVVMVPGLSDPVNAIVVQALNIFSYVTRVAARFSNPILVCCASASVYTLAQEVIRDVYQQEGAIDRYDQDSVRFISDRQFAFAAGVSGILLREQAAATFFLGEFYAESLILAETANSIGAIQVASSTESTQTPFFIAACDYVLIGDEFYAASAYLTRQPVLVGSLVGQDWCKMLVICSVLLGALVNSAQLRGNVTTELATSGDQKGSVVQVSVPSDPNNPNSPLTNSRPAEIRDTVPSHLLNPVAPDIKVVRPDDPDYPKTPAAGGGQ